MNLNANSEGIPEIKFEIEKLNKFLGTDCNSQTDIQLDFSCHAVKQYIRKHNYFAERNQLLKINKSLSIQDETSHTNYYCRSKRKAKQAKRLFDKYLNKRRQIESDFKTRIYDSQEDKNHFEIYQLSKIKIFKDKAELTAIQAINLHCYSKGYKFGGLSLDCMKIPGHKRNIVRNILVTGKINKDFTL